MKRLYKILPALALCAAAWSCTSDPATDGGGMGPDGAPLNLSVSFDGLGTRLAELGTPEDMNEDTVDGTYYGLKNVGLYIYYSSDYDADDLTKPYVRNLECRIENGNTLVPVEGDRTIYIYDKMTVVAFYPYNEDMNDPENYFEKPTDEKNYYITRRDYSEQFYIPYRAETTTNPTVSYYTELAFYPRATYKVEIVVVSDDESDFVPADEVVILPNIDPIDTDLSASDDGKRMKWYDGTPRELTDRGGGSNVRQYWAYIWTGDEDRNDIPQGEILLQAGRLTLIASQPVAVQEQHVYRYGYNMSTGEIFIPTSTNLVWDAQSLADYSGGSGKAVNPVYQVCDIDLDGVAWQPKTLSLARYDGGGHKIENLVINSTDERNVGLFSRVTYNSTVCNVNLIEPQITVNSSDTVSVGAICGQLNDVLTEEDIAALITNLPPGLSEVVKAAIIADLLKDAYNGTSRVVACRVEDPSIEVNAIVPRVGTICGVAGARNDDGEYKSVVKDTYSLGGSISVNAGMEENNTGGSVGGFIGLNNGTVIRSFTSITDITFDMKDPGTGVLTPAWQGFTTMGDLFDSAADRQLTDDYAVADDANADVRKMPTDWPAWSSATPWWPVLTTGWITGDESYWYSPGSPPDDYPILQWQRR